MIVEETTTELFDFLDIDITEDSLFTQLEKGESRYIRDLKVNVKNVLESEHLSPLETALLSLSIASNENNKKLIDSFINRSRKYDASEAQIAEAIACASLLASNNVFYRFRHFINKESYNKMPGKIKMQIMMKPELGKEFFEVMSGLQDGQKVITSSYDHFGDNEVLLLK